jgi:hypothetical protein
MPSRPPWLGRVAAAGTSGAPACSFCSSSALVRALLPAWGAMVSPSREVLRLDRKEVVSPVSLRLVSPVSGVGLVSWS